MLHGLDGTDGKDSVSVPIVWRKWLVFPHPVLRQFSLTHAAQLREWPKGLVDGVSM